MKLNLSFGSRLILTCTMILIFIPGAYTQYPEKLTSQDKNEEAIPFGLKSSEWKRLNGIWGRSNYFINLSLNDESSLSGQVLFLSRDSLFLWKDRNGYFNPLCPENILVVDKQTVDQIYLIDRHFNKKGIKNGMITGLVVGSAAGLSVVIAGAGWISPFFILPPAIAGSITGAYFGESISRKETIKQIYTSATIDPEIDMTNALTPYQLIDISSIDSISGVRHDLLYCQETMGLEYIAERSSLTNKVFFIPLITVSGGIGQYYSGYLQPDYLSRTYSYYLDLLFNINVSFSAGAFLEGLEYHHLHDIRTNLMRGWEYMGYYLYGLKLNYKLFPGTRFYPKPIQPSAEIGLTMTRAQKESYVGLLNTIPEEGNLDAEIASYGHTSKYLIPGFYAGLACDLFIGRRASIFMAAGRNFALPKKVEEISYFHPQTNEKAGIEKQILSVSGWKTSFGIRLHLYHK